MAVPSRCCLQVHLSMSFIGLLIGLCGFFVFLITYANYQACFIALVSAVLATLCLHLHLLVYSGQLQLRWSSNTLLAVVICSAALTLLALIAFIFYIYQLSQNHYNFYPISASAGVRAVMSFMSLKWALTLCIIASNYRRYLIYDQPSYSPIGPPSCNPVDQPSYRPLNDNDLVVDINT